MVSDNAKEVVLGLVCALGKIANQTPDKAFSELARMGYELSSFAFWYQSSDSIDLAKAVEGSGRTLILSIFNYGKTKKDICILLSLTIGWIADELLKVSEKMEE
jgi:hypothetical protein